MSGAGGWLVPQAYFVTAGTADSDESELNAFDEALVRAGIAQCNLVKVSSILPPGAAEIDPVDVPAGTVTFAVLVTMTGGPGDVVSAGVGWARYEDEAGRLVRGFVVEEHGHKTTGFVDEELRRKLDRMARTRGIPEGTKPVVRTRVASLSVPENRSGAAVCAVVMVPAYDGA